MRNLKLLSSVNIIILFFILLKLALHFIFVGEYGYFRDELYYVACGEHLAWGFVDQPPFTALIAKITTSLFGKSLFALRLFPVITGGFTILLTGLIIKELGGKRFALILGLMATVLSPVLLGSGKFLSMNAFDVTFCTLSIYFLIRLIKSGNSKSWIYLGLAMGVGLLNKISPLFIGFGLLVGLLLTENRKYLIDKYLWIAGIIALLIFSPYIIWNISNGFPTLEFMSNAAKYKNTEFSPLSFFLQTTLEMNPPSIIFVIGLLAYLFIRQLKQFRILAWIFLSILILFMFTNAKPYYISIIVPMVLGAGAVSIELLFDNKFPRILKPIFIIFLIPGYLFPLPFALPVLSPDNFISYSNFTGIKTANSERSETGSLPQHFADMFGWEEMAQEVSRVYLTLPEEDREKVVVLGQNYGEAGAIDFFRDKYPLPPAVSPHNNYWFWKYPEGYNGEVMIVIGSNLEDNSEFFEEVTEAGAHFNRYGMPYENVSIFICRRLKLSGEELWDQIKRFI